MKKLIILLIFSLTSLSAVFSQTASDALRYSRIFYSGTSRFQGMAGSFGALGADFSVVATNPAGLGLYKSSEITFTPSVSINPTTSDYNLETATDTRTVFAVGNFGFVFNIKPNKKSSSNGLNSFSFAFGMNRQNDYNANVFMEGLNNSSSLMTDYTNTLNNQPGITYDQINVKYPFDIALATNANLIYYDSTFHQFMCDAPNGGVIQRKYLSTWGSINEFAFSWAGNLGDQLYFGATLGVPVLRYYEESTYQEFKNDPSIPYFQSLTYGQYLETHGAGINFKAGVIYRPADWVRIGAAIHTPTYYGNMRDQWSSYMSADLGSIESIPQYSPTGYYNYHMTTPFRAIGSIGFVISQYGLLNAEYEYANYNQARFHSSESSTEFNDVNDEIKSSFTAPVNIRFGTEWRIENFRIRGGFGYYGQPYKSGINTGEKYVASGGFGYRSKHFFGDITYTWSKMNQDYYFYDRNLVNPSHNTYSNNIIMTTFGFRF
jgi:hypothetical protein